MMLQGIRWLGHASFRLGDGLVVYIDPWKLANPEPADLILITHAHRDHCSVEDVRRIVKTDSLIVCPASCLEKLGSDLAGRVRTVAPGDAIEVLGLSVEAVPSYNTNKPNHPKAAGNVGYVVEIGGQRIYHAGDTDLIPEMAAVCCDVALLPVGGTYTMNVEEAAQAVARIKPRVAVPMHYGDIVGSVGDGQRFAGAVVAGAQVVVLQAE